MPTSANARLPSSLALYCVCWTLDVTYFILVYLAVVSIYVIKDAPLTLTELVTSLVQIPIAFLFATKKKKKLSCPSRPRKWNGEN